MAQPRDTTCFAAVESTAYTTIQRVRVTRPGACTREGTKLLKNKAEGVHRFCKTHARMALEGKIDASGDCMTRNDRNVCSRLGHAYFYTGEWQEV